MIDPRLEKLAQVLIHYSLELKKGDQTLITGGPLGEPLLVALYKIALQAGAHPRVLIKPDQLDELLVRYGSEEQLRFVDPLEMHEMDQLDAWLRVRAESNTRHLSNASPRKQALLSQGRYPILQKRVQRAAENKLRWCGTQFPTPASAQDAGMSLTEYEDFVFSACLIDCEDPVAAWRELGQRQQELVDLLNTRKTLHIEAANGTDLTMSIEGRKWINCCGTVNFPDGEVFTGPVEDSVNGRIVFSFPAVHMGRECDGIELQFENGRVVKATAQKGEDFLLEMLDQDAGARGVGEIAVGTNFGIKQFTRNTLFDEKIGGTVHLAVGASYPQTGGMNQSGLHWDMVCDLRTGGRVTADGQVIQEYGKFTVVDI